MAKPNGAEITNMSENPLFEKSTGFRLFAYKRRMEYAAG